MKLIDILVRELPNRGGWPVSIDKLVQNSIGCVYQAGGGIPLWRLEVAHDWELAEISRDQYYTALAASKEMLINKPQPVWNGEGRPPVGSRMEALTAGEWVEVTVAYHDKKVSCRECLVFDTKTTRPFWADEFRTIRTEAERKRSDICDKIYGALCKAEREGNRSDMAECVYDAIAAGKIPGVKLEAPDDH